MIFLPHFLLIQLLLVIDLQIFIYYAFPDQIALYVLPTGWIASVLVRFTIRDFTSTQSILLNGVVMALISLVADQSQGSSPIESITRHTLIGIGSFTVSHLIAKWLCIFNEKIKLLGALPWTIVLLGILWQGSLSWMIKGYVSAQENILWLFLLVVWAPICLGTIIVFIGQLVSYALTNLLVKTSITFNALYNIKVWSDISVQFVCIFLTVSLLDKSDLLTSLIKSGAIFLIGFIYPIVMYTRPILTKDIS